MYEYVIKVFCLDLFPSQAKSCVKVYPCASLLGGSTRKVAGTHMSLPRIQFETLVFASYQDLVRVASSMHGDGETK